jgi:ribosomal protein L11 methyltransferase
MAWIQVRFESDKQHSDIFEQLLTAIGAKAVTLLEPKDQPLYETLPYSYPMWDNAIMVGLFTSDQSVQENTERMAQWYQQETGQSFPEYQIEILEDRVWETTWSEDFKPMQFGQKLWVCPSWHTLEEQDAVSLILDPGLAFGTGTHPTTRLCLNWLDTQAAEDALTAKILCDFGCGSGILGIAGLKLGAQHLTAVDIDPKALTETRLNADRNGILAQQYECYLPTQAPQKHYDIVIANILAGPLLELAEHLQTITRTGGLLLLSGILEEQAEEIMKHYQQWFDLIDPEIEDGWVRLEGRKR